MWRAGLLYHLWEKGVRDKLFRVLAQMCDRPTSMVWHDGHLSSPFHPEMGWEQGDTLATTMFNICINALCWTLRGIMQAFPSRGPSLLEPIGQNLQP